MNRCLIGANGEMKGAAKHVFMGSVATPDEEKDLEKQP